MQRLSLDGQAAEWKIWQTPATDSFRSRGGDRKDEMGLDQQARHWPTPQTADDQRKATKASHQMMLSNLAPHWSPECPSPPLQVIRDGPISSKTSRVLNPRFVEWLMGWPLNWTVAAGSTVCAPAETVLSHWLLLMRGALLKICSRDDDQQGKLL
jgi:DNA (cytosine-5)-methyltransferase 1